MKQRALVTGAEGFVGRILCAHLTAQGWEVAGCDRCGGDTADRRVCDITDLDQVHALFDWAGQVTHVFHLAALTFVPDAVKDPAAAVKVNLEGTIHVASALRDHAPDARLVYVGSSEVYGPPKTLPIDEDHPLNPASPYAIAKAAADQYCAFFHKETAANVVRVRPFNHSGPGQSDRFVLSSFARQIAGIETGRLPPSLEVGDLTAARDFLHVSDVVRAYERLAMAGNAGEAYNVCSGRSWPIQEALDRLLRLSGADVKVTTDPGRLRKVDIPEMRGSHEKLTRDTGWTPRISFDSLLGDLLEYWRAREHEGP